MGQERQQGLGSSCEDGSRPSDANGRCLSGGSASWEVCWDVLDRTLGPSPFLVAGIVNVTPDSFFDGGLHAHTSAAISWGQRLAAQGADILDVGGESTRPGADPVDERTEAERVIPVIAGLARELAAGCGSGDKRPALSIDTTKAGVAKAGIKAGAVIVNDVSACRMDPALADVLGHYRPGYVLMHAQGRPREMQCDPRYQDVVAEVLSFFEERMAYLTSKGLPEGRIVLDPGIGFGKTLEHNLELLRNVPRLLTLGRPVYMGLSNKSWLGALLGLNASQRGGATHVATALTAAAGARIHRVHDVAGAVQSLILAQTLGSNPGGAMDAGVHPRQDNMPRAQGMRAQEAGQP